MYRWRCSLRWWNFLLIIKTHLGVHRILDHLRVRLLLRHTEQRQLEVLLQLVDRDHGNVADDPDCRVQRR